MNDAYKLAAYGALINGALYLGCLLVLGIVMHSPIAWKCSLVGSGTAFLCYLGQTMGADRRLLIGLMVISILFPAIGGFALLALAN